MSNLVFDPSRSTSCPLPISCLIAILTIVLPDIYTIILLKIWATLYLTFQVHSRSNVMLHLDSQYVTSYWFIKVSYGLSSFTRYKFKI